MSLWLFYCRGCIPECPIMILSKYHFGAVTPFKHVTSLHKGLTFYAMVELRFQIFVIKRMFLSCYKLIHYYWAFFPIMAREVILLASVNVRRHLVRTEVNGLILKIVATSNIIQQFHATLHFGWWESAVNVLGRVDSQAVSALLCGLPIFHIWCSSKKVTQFYVC